MMHRVAMRRLLAEHGIAQPAFAAVRTLHEGQTALASLGLPALLRPDNVNGRTDVFLLESEADLERHLHAALAQSPTHEAILEAPPGEGTALVAVAGDDLRLAEVLPAGWFQPTRLYSDRLAAAEETVTRTLRVLPGTTCVDLLATEDEVRVVAASPSPPRMELARLLEQSEPAAVHLLTGLPEGRVRRLGSLDKVFAFPGVVEADVRVEADEVTGYVLAVGATNLEAIERAEAAARLVDVEVW